MSNVISVENLGKKYLISHQGREPYTALRDVLADGARAFCRRMFTPGTSQVVAHAEEFWALKDVSFEVKQGDRIGIIGRNGAGKSTLLKILSRITEPTEGRVRIRGRIASLLEVGTGFHPELTGRENIFLNGAILGMNRAEIARKFDEIVAFAEIEKFLDTPVKRYSSGMYVRLAFAVAAHLEPEILIVDEVLAVGDSQFQAKCLIKMKSVAESGRTVLFVSHNMGVVGNFCTRLILLHSGNIVAQGSNVEVVERYLSLCQDALDAGRNLVRQHPSMLNDFFIPERIELYCDGRPATVVKMGASLQIVLSYSQKKNTNYLKIGIHILDSGGNLICVLSPNQQLPDFQRSLKRFGAISCTIRTLNLISGIYSLNLHYEIPGATKSCCIESVATFQIVDKDIYGTGVIPSKMHGLVFFPADWSF
ncbi:MULTISPECIES: ABC transporter ATP-binding protein [Geobacter]|uniref:ABC transporter ATP-binding protein n=1 Tax=Geobacter TaxID=28231 RepID=UPI0025735980|nr:ABC transporter ATP-binding protein [Geobacter sulfurreducens]BEH10511.1 ABC transporter ATP-binding protein [Geobacter sulfurreducens subsp. ethanolicus]BET57880.1 ABC transporter ATP-binding protein [Geobacter sp. 60473]